MACHAEREGGFANSGSGGQNDHFAGLKAGGELIELIETGGDTAVVALAFDEALDNGDGFRGDLGRAEDSLGFPATTDFENISFSLIEDGLDFVSSILTRFYEILAGEVRGKTSITITPGRKT